MNCIVCTALYCIALHCIVLYYCFTVSSTEGLMVTCATALQMISYLTKYIIHIFWIFSTSLIIKIWNFKTDVTMYTMCLYHYISIASTLYSKSWCLFAHNKINVKHIENKSKVNGLLITKLSSWPIHLFI